MKELMVAKGFRSRGEVSVGFRLLVVRVSVE